MADTGYPRNGAGDHKWLHVAGESPYIDPRQRFTIKSLKSWANVEALEDSVAELDQALTDIRKIRNFCASLPRISGKG